MSSEEEDDGMDNVDLEDPRRDGHASADSRRARQQEEDSRAERAERRREEEEVDVHDIAHPFDATHDCFDDFDGKAVQEPEDVKARRLEGKSDWRDQLKAFDSRAVFYVSLFLFEWVLLLLWPPLFLAFCLVVVAPLRLFYAWWKQQQKECSLPTVVHAVGRGFYDVTFMMICASYGALIVGLIILFWFYDAGAFKKGDDSAAIFTFYVFVIVPFVASEECLKAMFVRLQRKKLRQQGHNEVTRAHLIHSTGTSVGYALGQAFGWTVITHIVLMSNDADYASSGGAQVGWMLLVGILVTAFGTPLQLLSGYLIGLEVTRESWHWWSLSLGIPLALRSAYYISAVGLLLLIPSTFGALAVWFMVNVLLCGAMYQRVRQVEALMPQSYLRRVGYLRWGGYGVLEAADDDGDDGTGIQAGVHDAPPLFARKPLAHAAPATAGGGGGMEMQAMQEPRGSGGGGGAPAAKAKAPAAPPAAPAPSATRDSVIARLNAIKQANAAKAAAAKAAAAPAPAAPAAAAAASVGGTVNPMQAEEADCPIDAEEVDDDTRAVL